MSRIGKAPITIPSKVSVTVNDKNFITVKGPNGELSRQLDHDMIVKQEGTELTVERPTDQKRHKAVHGLTRSLINNMVVGVSDGFKKELDVIGVGFRAVATGQKLELVVGYSHPVVVLLPKEVAVTAVTEKGVPPRVTLQSNDKQLLGQVAAKIRSIRKPEVYKGKGIRIVGEFIRKKAGKSASK